MAKDRVKGQQPTPERKPAVGPTERKFVAQGIGALLGLGVPQWRLSQEQQRPPAFVPPKKRRGR
jgi:hypothetical protein